MQKHNWGLERMSFYTFISLENYKIILAVKVKPFDELNTCVNDYIYLTFLTDGKRS